MAGLRRPFYDGEIAFDLWGCRWLIRWRFGQLSTHIHPPIATGFGWVCGDPRRNRLFEINFRIIIGDEIRWISARGQGADAGIVDGVMFGIFLDATGRKQAGEGSELLAGEMSPCVKNLLSTATGLTHLTGRSAQSVETMTKELTDRLTALGPAHNAVRPLPGHKGRLHS